MNHDTIGGGAIGSPPSSPQTRGGATGSPTSSSQTGGVKQELADDAKTVGKAARERLDNKASQGKEQASQAAKSTSSALGKAAEQMRQDDSTPAWLTSAFEKTAREIDRFAGSLEGKDMQAIRRDVGSFARQSPLAFLAASAVAGFAAARVLRAGGDYREHHGADGQQANAGMTGQPGANAGSGLAQDRSSFAWGNEGATPASNFEGAGQ